MKFFQPALLFTLLFVFVFSAAAQNESLASRTWEVQKYDITATLPQTEADRYLNVNAVLNLKNVSSGAASRLTLRISDKAEVASVKVNNSTAAFSKSQEKIGVNLNLQRTVVSLPSMQPNQTFSVEVVYKLKVEENSGLNALSPAGSQFLPLSFWYPTPNSWYFARGADFAPFNLTIAASNTAVSSGIGVDPASSGGTSFSFNQKLNGQPFFVTGNWELINAGGVSVYLPKGASAEEQKRAGELANLASEAKNFTAGLLGAAPEVPLKIVTVRRGAGFSGGGTVLIDESAFRRQKIDSQTASTIAEAVVKLWIGNLAKVEGEGYGVIQEGLSRYIATQFIEQKYGREIADLERLRQRTAYTAIVKRDAPLNIVSPLDDYYFSEVANKGAMIWRLLAKKVGRDEFLNVLRSSIKNGSISLNTLRSAFPAEKNFLDYAFNQVTDMNLLVGLPQTSGGDTKIALRNTGSIDATVNIVATAANGEKFTSQTTIPATGFGEVTFKTPNKIVRAEIDAEKFYPQTDFSDDVAPREFTETDLLLFVKRAFDRQDFAVAEKNALTVLRTVPHFDDVRILLARSFLAQGKVTDAEREFRFVLDEKLPTARSLAWANVGLGEINLKAGQKARAAEFFTEAIKTDAEYGATLLAWQGWNNLNAAATTGEDVKSFFAQFDKAATAGRKTDLDALVLSGEIPRFSSGIAGQAQQWETKILQSIRNSENSALVAVNLNTKLLNKNPESGLAIFRLTKVGGVWKLSGVEVFEVR